LSTLPMNGLNELIEDYMKYELIEDYMKYELIED
jgi:hypothetical protein